MMNTTTQAFKGRKAFALAIHILCMAITLVGIGFLYFNDYYGKGISWLLDEKYEDTAAFSNQIQEDVQSIFEYIRYKDVFETDDVFDQTKPVVNIYYREGDDREFTIEELVRYAKNAGYYLDDKYNVQKEEGGVVDPVIQEEGRLSYSAFNPDPDYDYYANPPEEPVTIESVAVEVLTYLGSYYSIQNTLIDNKGNLYFNLTYQDDDGTSITYTNAEDMSSEDLRGLGKYVYVAGDLVTIDTNMTRIIRNINTLAEQNNPYETNTYHMIAAIDTTYPADDIYAQESAAYHSFRNAYILNLSYMLIGLLMCLLTLIYLILVSGRQDKTAAIHLHQFDRIPAEAFLLLCLIGMGITWLIGQKILAKIVHILVAAEQWAYWDRMLRLLILYVWALFCGFSMLRRYKSRTLWPRSLTRRLVKVLRLHIRNWKYSLMLLCSGALYLGINTLCIAGAGYFFFIQEGILSKFLTALFIILWVAANGAAFHLASRHGMQRDKINEAITRISSGETSYKVSLDDFTGRERSMAQQINNISSGIETALQEKIRSERMKTDLITNVSHDIKTPLTSIINYVDLMKREQIQNPKILEYLDVLEQKSLRLKNLIEDLVEASKASSGNLKLDITDIDIVELVQQTTGEFEEKFAVRGLNLILNIPNETILIEVDGPRLWRVLENLYNNAYKYALQNSRVYVDITRDDSYVTFTLKNISERPLNIRPDELTERFVRGDVSRATEGSGLGLSIAKSLTELQHGEFQIYIDGDLYKAEIRFPIKKQDTI